MTSAYIYCADGPTPQVREAQLAQYNFILIVGEKEREAGGVNVRTRDNEVIRPPSFYDRVLPTASMLGAPPEGFDFGGAFFGGSFWALYLAERLGGEAEVEFV